MPFFEEVEMLPEDPILGIPVAIKADKRPNIVNLGIGAYKTSDGKPYVLNCVRTAEAQILQKKLNKDYLPIEGDPLYLTEIQKLAFGNDSEAIKSGRIYSVQTIGGSFALRLAGDFLKGEVCNTIYLPDPTWINHHLMFKRAGLNDAVYPYYSTKTNELDFEGMCAAVKKMTPGCAMLLHGCCHNPTGTDLSMDQWKELSALIKTQQIIPFFDIAYQGFGDGLDADVAPLKYFVQEHPELLVSYSCSKNFGLYGDRVGALHVLTQNKEISQRVGSYLKMLVRGSYSSPPLHGGRIVSTILTSPELRKEWGEELTNMRERVIEMRDAFVTSLQAKVDHMDFSFVLKQKGMFSYCGLDQADAQRLRDEKAIYMPMNGRINMAGLNMENMHYLVDSIAAVLQKT